MDQAITLYIDAFWVSPYALTSYVSLKEKGLSFELKEVGLHNKEQRESDYVAKTILGKVPALSVGSFHLTESNAIAEYIEEKYSNLPRLFPQNIEHRARARQIMGWIRSDLMPIREERSTYTMFYPDLKSKKALSADGIASAKKLIQVCEALIPQGEGNLFGDWCIADTDLAFMISRLVLNDDEVPERIRRYAHTQMQRPFVKEFFDHKRIPYVHY